MPVRVRETALWLFAHEVQKVPQRADAALRNVLCWLDEQREKDKKRRLEPSIKERLLLRLLVVEGLTFKQIALRTGGKVSTTKKNFQRMRNRMGDITLYQLVALSVERGWIKIQEK